MIRELARRRGSSKNFRAESVEFSAVTQILETARQAPSGANKQPWKFIVVDKPELKSRIREACEQGERKYHKKAPQWMRQWMQKHKITPTKSFLTEPPYLVAVCSDIRAPYHIQSTWIALGFILLAVEEMGLGTLTYTPSEVSTLRRILKIPKECSLEAIVPIGISNERRRKHRRSLEELVYVNTWGETVPL